MVSRSIGGGPGPGKDLALRGATDARPAPVALRRFARWWLLALCPPLCASAGERTLTLAGGVEMPFVWVAPGEFTMGGPLPLPHDPHGHRVRVRLTAGFYLGRTEITQQQWVAVMDSRPWAGRPHVVDDPRRPAVFFSWRELGVFVERLGAATGQRLRLPTEAEWEYACRAGVTGEGPDLDDEAWYYETACAPGQCSAMPAAAKRPNPWGLFDMRGNVWEWVADWYSPTYGLSGVEGAAVDPRGPARGSHRVKRGGSFYDFRESVHCGARDGYSEDGRYVNIGARLVLEPR